MASPATLYRFRLTISDVDRGFYDSIDVRVAMHPSETEAYLLTRLLAYALNFEPGLEFAPGLCTGDEPAIRLTGTAGETTLWIDIGNPSPRKIHKASKASRRVRIYTYKDPVSLQREAAGETIHRKEEIEAFALEPAFLAELGQLLKRDNDWGLIQNGGELAITAGERSILGTLRQFSLRAS